MLDLLILTAASDRQAAAYSLQLRERRRRGNLRAAARFGVLPDPRGLRVGSGAATLLALRRIALGLGRDHPGRTIEERFRGLRILILHSGGDSRRLPAYAAQGKVFAPLPLNDDPDLALFDAILADLSGLRLSDEGRVVIAAGDVLLGIGAHLPALDRPGVTGIAYPDSLDRASRHGVYVRDADGRVADFVHKAPPDQLRARGAVLPDGRALVDSGLLSLAPQAVGSWLRAAGVGAEPGLRIGEPLRSTLDGRASIDLYAEMLDSMSDRAHARTASRWRGSLAFHVEVADRCDFLHLGSTSEFINELTSASENPSGARSRRVCPGGIRVLRSCVSTAHARMSPPAVIDACESDVSFRLHGRNVLVGLPRQATRELDLPSGIGLVLLPMADQAWSALIFGVDDDFKTPRAASGSLANRPLDRWLDTAGLNPAHLWDDPDPTRQTLWNARLWSTGPIDEVLDACLWIGRQEPAPTDWTRRERLTAPEVYARVDLPRLLARLRRLARRARTLDTIDRVLRDRLLGSPDIRDASPGRAQQALARSRIRHSLAAAGDALERARLGAILHSLGHDPGGAHAARALRAVSSLIEREVHLPSSPPHAVVEPGVEFEAIAPARIDLAGGWSDTPPICIELGGRVVNTSIAIHGRPCVSARARLIAEPIIRIASRDLGMSMIVRESGELARHADPSHWAALPMSALLVCGMAPSDPTHELSRWLAELGGGVELTIESRVPKGSGLGTSSILSAAAIAALGALTGRPLAPEVIFARTSLLEQLMRTGGGWQDQVGGVIGGFKITRSAPGADQVLDICPLEVPERARAELRSRAVLLDTGIQRMARGILRQIVLRYLAREAGVVDTVRQLHANAEAMASALREGDVDGAARELGEYWSLKRDLDPGSCPPEVEALTAPMAGRAFWSLAGAGGGGFLFAIAHDEREAAKFRARFVVSDFEFDDHGLRVTPRPEGAGTGPAPGGRA